MKKLILTTLLVSTSLYAAGPVRNEMADANDAKQIVSKLKDVEVTAFLDKTGEFNECRKKYPYVESDPNKDANLKLAETCFRQKLAKETDKEKLKQMSESLNLQQYGLVPSNNLKDVQNYLADKMYESMTGVNRKESDQKKLIDSMKFGKKKNIDQKVFIEMYKTQLGKNALYEVSRFCFEKLRFTTYPVAPGASVPVTFSEYWKPHVATVTVANASQFTDNGEPSFYKFDDATDKNKIYQDMFKNISAGVELGDTEMSNYFLNCGKIIVSLCDSFQSTVAGDSTEAGTKSKTDLATDATDKTKTNANTVTRGAAACLAKTRIQEYRLALTNAEKVAEYFEKDFKSEKAIQLMLSGVKGEPIKIYGQGGDDEPSVDDLTNNTAASFLDEYNKDQAAIDKADECAKKPELDNCKDFITAGDQLDKTKQKVELEMTLKRDIEMARVRELVAGDRKDLRQYLEDGGYFEILKQLDDKTLKDSDIEGLIGQVFEAKKTATLLEINNKLGNRQIKKGTTAVTKTAADELVKESKEERARLAQVVLFNNVITSHLSLKKKNSSGGLDPAGRNVNALKKETAALSGKINTAYFDNIKKDANSAQGIGKDSQIAGFEILDELLGKEQKP